MAWSIREPVNPFGYFGKDGEITGYPNPAKRFSKWKQALARTKRLWGRTEEIKFLTVAGGCRSRKKRTGKGNENGRD